MAENGYTAVHKPTLVERVMNVLFPQQYLQPAPDEDGWAPGEITTDTVITLSLGDRLRVLVTGKAVVRMRQQADVDVKRVRTRSAFSVLHPWSHR